MGFTPTVTDAASLSPNAVSRRPYRPLCIQTTSTPTTPSATVMKSNVPTSWSKCMPRKSKGLLRSHPRMWIDWIGRPSKPSTSGCGKNRNSAIRAKALEAQRGQRHRDPERDREQRGDEEAGDAPEGVGPFEEGERAGPGKRDLGERDLFRP